MKKRVVKMLKYIYQVDFVRILQDQQICTLLWSIRVAVTCQCVEIFPLFKPNRLIYSLPLSSFTNFVFPSIVIFSCFLRDFCRILELCNTSQRPPR